MKAMIEYGNKKIVVEGDDIFFYDRRLEHAEIDINSIKFDYSEFGEIVTWIEASVKLSCFED